MWVVGSLAAARPGWDGSRFPTTTTIHLPHYYLLPPQASGGPLTVSLQHFGRVYSWLSSAGHPQRACWSRMLGVRSICSPTEKEAVRNKQTDRQVERTQIIPTAASQHCLFPCYILSIHLFKSPFPHSLTVHLTTYSCESSLLKLMSVLNGSVSFYRVSAPSFYESCLFASGCSLCVLPPTAALLTSLCDINVLGLL